MKKYVLETVNHAEKDVALQRRDGEERRVKISNELRRKLVDENGRVGESEDTTANQQNEDVSMSSTNGTSINTKCDVVDSVPSFKIIFEENTVISLSPTRPSSLCSSLRHDTSVCSLQTTTSSSDVGTMSGSLSENEEKSPPATDKKALTGHLLQEISEVLDKIDLSYINKIRSEYKKQLENRKLNSGRIKDDKLINTGSEGGIARVGSSDVQGEVASSEEGSAKEDRVTARDEDAHLPIKSDENVVFSRNVSNDTNAPSRRNVTSAIVKCKTRLRRNKDGTDKPRDKVSFLDRMFSVIETFTPGIHIRSCSSPDDADSDSSISSDSSLDDDDSLVSGSEIKSGWVEALSSSSESDSELNDQDSSGRVDEIMTTIEDKSGPIPARSYPIVVYCFCFALFYLFWTICYTSCTYRRTFYGVTRNSNTWYCRAYDSFSKLTRLTPGTTEMQVTYKSNRKYYHPFQPW